MKFWHVFGASFVYSSTVTFPKVVSSTTYCAILFFAFDLNTDFDEQNQRLLIAINEVYGQTIEGNVSL